MPHFKEILCQTKINRDIRKPMIHLKNISILSISHANHQINLDVVLQGANPSQNMQVMKYYCGTSVFKPLIEQNLDTYIKVMNENNSVTFETEIQGMADCP